MVTAADEAYSAMQSHSSRADDLVLRPTGSASVIKKVDVATQPASVETQRSASVIALRQPSVAIEGMASQMPVAPCASHISSTDQIRAAAVRHALLILRRR